MLQGTGSATSVATAAMGHAHTVRDVFVSMLVSLHLQMRARYLPVPTVFAEHFHNIWG